MRKLYGRMGSSNSRHPTPAPKRGITKPPLLCAADFVLGVICPWLALNLVPLSGKKTNKTGSQCFTLQVVSAPSRPQEPTGPSLCGWGQLGPRLPGSARAIPEQFVMLKHQFPFISGQGFLGSGQLTQMEPQPCGLWSLKIKSARPQALIMSLSCPPLSPRLRIGPFQFRLPRKQDKSVLGWEGTSRLISTP